MIRKITIANVYGRTNLGDAALLEACLDRLKQMFPTAKFSGVAYLANDERKHLPEVRWYSRPGTSWIANRRIRHLLAACRMLFSYFHLITGIPVWRIPFLLPREQREGLRELSEADLVVGCPGGYFEDSNQAFVVNALQIRHCIYYQRRVVLAPQSIGPVRSAWGQGVLKWALRGVEQAHVRESESLRFATETLGMQNVTRSGDIAFWHERVSTEKVIQVLQTSDGESAQLPLKYLAVSVLAWAFPTSSDSVAAKARYESEVASTLDLIADRTGLGVVIVNQVSHDIDTAVRISKIATSRVLVDKTAHSVTSIKRLIGEAQYFFGSRFHSCIFAMQGGVPLVCISYLPKTTGIMQDLGLDDRVFGIESFAAANVAAYVIQELENGAAAARNSIGIALSSYRESYGNFEIPE